MLGTAVVLMGGIVPFFPEPKAPPIKAEPVFQIGPVVVTNSMLGAIVAFIVVLLLIRIATRKLEERPGKFQAGVEFVEDPTDYGNLRIATLKDPEGNLVQLLEPPKT